MRLRPLTLTTPKCLIPIYGVPLLDHWLAMLLASGIERVLINTHHLADAVRRHVRQSSWQDRIDLVHEQELLGTGGTILANRDYFGGRDAAVHAQTHLVKKIRRPVTTQQSSRVTESPSASF